MEECPGVVLEPGTPGAAKQEIGTDSGSEGNIYLCLFLSCHKVIALWGAGGGRSSFFRVRAASLAHKKTHRGGGAGALIDG